LINVVVVRHISILLMISGHMSRARTDDVLLTCYVESVQKFFLTLLRVVRYNLVALLFCAAKKLHTGPLARRVTAAIIAFQKRLRTLLDY
jgi:hypothetical protein